MSLRGFRPVIAIAAILVFGLTTSAQNRVHVVVDLHDPSQDHTNLDDLVKVRLSRLVAKGRVSDVFYGRDLKVPIGTYRIEALIDDDAPEAILQVHLRQPEIRVALGVSLLNCCINLPGRDVLGRLSVHLEAEGEPNQYTIRILPIWHNNDSIGVAVGPDWSAELAPVDLGVYVLVVLRGNQILLTKHVEIPEENPHVRLDLDLKADPQE
jgi:hypothetical protein